MSLSSLRDYGTKGPPKPLHKGDSISRAKVLIKIREHIGKTGSKESQRLLGQLVEAIQEMS